MAPPKKKKKPLKKVVFPVTRRVYPQLLAQQITSVQPMALPFGGIFSVLDAQYGRRRPVANQSQLNWLFKIWDKIQNKYPIGSTVTINVGLILWDGVSYHDNKGKPDIEKVIVTSEFYVLSQKGSIGFLCNKSKDDTDFYFADDLIEYMEIVKEVNDENK